MATDSEYRYGRNAEGYPDPTATKAFENISRKERQEELKRDAETMEVIKRLIPVLKKTADFAGFEIVGRIVLKDKATGKEWR